ncbi:hypothetical protein OJ998_20035 [Solirubrobacter taibaiensis]|nr:hypothetical protein [Solirubrobacter taibaiensis]
MRGVQPAVRADRFAQRLQLLRGRGDPRRVLQPGREPGRAASIASRTIPRNLSSSTRVSSRSSNPATLSRSDPCGTSGTTFTAGRAASSAPRYVSKELGVPTRSHALRQQNVVIRAASTACGSTGASPWPQLPTATVVMPVSTLDCARPSTSSVKSACEWMSTIPGATTIPVASITARAPPDATSVPTAVIRPASIATSTRSAAAPVPSTTVPPEIRVSITRAGVFQRC